MVAIGLSKYILHQAHDALGHGSTARTCQCLKQLCYWKGLCKDVDIHVQQCIKCTQQNLHLGHYAELYLRLPLMPTHFIVMDLIGTFEPSPQGHQYTLTVIDVLTNYTWCIPLFTKEAD